MPARLGLGYVGKSTKTRQNIAVAPLEKRDRAYHDYDIGQPENPGYRPSAG
jgi:hypothetical protein